MNLICGNCGDEFEWADSPSDDYCVGCYTVGGIYREEEEWM